MIRTLFLLILIVSLTKLAATAQVLVQDSKSSSSIRYRGNAINLDPTQGRASFAINSYETEYKPDKKYGSMWGLQGSAASKSGLAGIINAGSLVPEGSFLASGGITITRNRDPKFNATQQTLDAVYDARAKGITAMAEELDAIEESFNTRVASSTLISGDLSAAITNIFQTKGTTQLADAVDALSREQKDAAVKTELNTLASDLRIALTSYQAIRQLSAKQVERYRDQVRRSFWRERHLVYGSLGGSASSFSYLSNQTLTTNFNDRFEKKKLESVRWSVGYNYQKAGNTVVGLNINGQKVDNFSDLTATEYTISNTTQINSATAIQTQPTASTTVTQKIDDKQIITGYSGDYQVAFQTSINADLVKFYKGTETSQGVVAINYYARWLLSSRPSVIPSTFTLGLGTYFFQNNGAFLGGLYIELPDITNQAEKLKSTPTFKPFYNRISFGVVTKFSISSIIAYGL